MSTPAKSLPPPSGPASGLPHDLVLRAAALVNPTSGLANDYLNVFNEIVMMIDLLPDMPDLAGNIEAWSPITYRAYFQRSNLAGREDALACYDRLDPAFRSSFERCAADLAQAARAACTTILGACARADDDASHALADLCGLQARKLRERLDKITDMVNGNGFANSAAYAVA